MHVTDDGSVVGSIDRAKLADLEKDAKSDYAKDQLGQLRSEAEAAESEADKAADSQPEEVRESEPSRPAAKKTAAKRTASRKS